MYEKELLDSAAGRTSQNSQIVSIVRSFVMGFLLSQNRISSEVNGDHFTRLTELIAGYHLNTSQYLHSTYLQLKAVFWNSFY